MTAACLGAHAIDPVFQTPVCTRASFAETQKLLSQPASCLTQLLTMHTSYTQKQISESQFTYHPNKISCDLEIPETLLKKVFSQKILPGEETYFHINSNEIFWHKDSHRNDLRSLLFSQNPKRMDLKNVPTLQISYDKNNMSHKMLAQRILERLCAEHLQAFENPLESKIFINSYRDLDFPIVDWNVVGLELPLLAQLMFDEHSQWSLKKASQLLQNSNHESPHKLFDLAFKIS